MNAITLYKERKPRCADTQGSKHQLDDPLDADCESDVPVSTTRRGLTRLALVAAETGARSQREGIGHDPMAWIQAPRRLFNGAIALEACLERDHCLRAILLHGLSIGLDASPASIDALIADTSASDEPGDPWASSDSVGLAGNEPRGRRMRLYTATILVARGGEILHAFHASVAPAAAVVRERIRARFGSAAATRAVIRVGFDPECANTVAMVPPAVLDTLVRASQRSSGFLMEGLDITVEQRLPS